MAEPLYKFLDDTLGKEGSAAIHKACERIPGLDTVLLPRAVWAWLQFVAPYNYSGTIPGTNSTLRLTKAENNKYTGQVTWCGKIYNYIDANLYQLAAAVALAVGAKAKSVNVKVDAEEITALGKSVDVLVKAYAANQQLRKAEAPLAPAAPNAPKIGGENRPKQVRLPGTKKLQPKLPSVKVTKAELDSVCDLCGKRQFNKNQFVGCTCLKALSKSVTSTTKPDGVLLTFGKGWAREDVDTLLGLLRNENGQD